MGQAPPRTDEQHFLEGPQSRLAEFRRVTRIASEFIRGFRRLHFLRPCVTVFGSARFGADHRYYAMARELGRRVAEAGLHRHDRRRPGHHGGRQPRSAGGGRLHGRLQHRAALEQEPNAYLDRWVEFRYFFVRKVMLVKYSYAFAALPGGYGTMDEVFETATLIQTGKIEGFPVVLLGRDYWSPLMDFLHETMIPEGTIDAREADYALLTDDVDEALEAILTGLRERFGFEPRPQRRRSRLLGEKDRDAATTQKE